MKLTLLRSPIERVPPELLCEIFEHCLPKTSATAPIVVSHTYEAPLLLCQVCSEWRRTALAFPPLWKALALQSTYTFDHETNLIITVHPSIAAIVSSWFARAASCPLSLGLDLQIKFVEESEFTLKMEDMLNGLPNSRLQHLSLSAFYPDDTYFLSKISQEFTELESIVLKASSRPDSLSVPHRLLQSAPCLRSAEFYNFIQPHIFSRSLIPWSQLTHLRVEGHLGEMMWYILVSHCTSLQHGIFSIGRKDAGTRIPTSNQKIILPHLVDLTIHITEREGKPNFRQLVFPMLRRLQLLFERTSFGFGILWDGNLPAIDSNSLNCFVFVGVIRVEEPRLHSLFQLSLSSITELHLSMGTLDGTSYINFFKTITFSPDPITQPLLPKLEVLQCEIRGTGDADTMLHSLFSFVGSRWDQPTSALPATHTVARLRRLTLNFQGAMPGMEEFVDQVRQLLAPFKDQGLCLGLGFWTGRFKHLRKMMKYEPES